METPQAPESFRSLLLRHRGRTGLIQRDLAARAGVSLRSVQDWEAGVTLPTAERLQALVRALLDMRGLTPGREIAEARDLWAAVERETTRMHTPFDNEWFSGLLGMSRHSLPERAQDWGEAPDSTEFVGRAEELAELREWVLQERVRLVGVLGMGGIGKTSLAARLAQDVAPSFERVYWRSLRNAPPVAEWLAGAIGFLSAQHLAPPPSESERITALLQLLRTKRCLLVLDNSETLLEPGEPEGRYRAGMDGYGRLLAAVGETSHQSCLVLTSREEPPELAVLGGGARCLELHGLGTLEAQALLADKQLAGDAQAWITLVGRYGGNGLALKIVSETIRQVYAGDVGAFLAAIATSSTAFGGIRRLLDAQAERLSPMERDVLTRLAVEREPMSVTDLSADLALRAGRNSVIEAIENLRRRSLVERGERGATFTLQSMVLEYVTDRLVETIGDEIDTQQPGVLLEQPLIKAQATEYVRQTQERLIGAPIVQHLNARHAERGAEERLLALLDGWRGRAVAEQACGPGNVANLLRLQRGDLRGIDLSRLALRQVYLQGVDAQAASLADASLTEAVLDAAFDYPTSVALSVDRGMLAAGTTTGEVRLWRPTDRTLLLAVRGHTGAIWGLALSGDGRLVASGGVDGMLNVWEAPGGRPVATWRGHMGEIRAVALARDGRALASGGVDGTVKLWAPSGERLATLEGHTGAVWGVAFSGDGRLVASAAGDGTVRLWEVLTARPVTVLAGHAGLAYGVALSADGRLVASGAADGRVRLWDAASGQVRATLRGHEGLVLGVAFSGDDGLVASGGADGTVRLWEVGSGQPLATAHRHNGLVYGVALSGDGRLLASCGGDSTLRLSEPASGHVVATLQGYAGLVYGVALSGDGRLLASGNGDATVRLWDAASGDLRATLHGHKGLVMRVAFSGDAGLVVSAGLDGTVRLWDVGSGQPRATLHAHDGLVYGAALSGDGRLVASAGLDGTVRLWDAATGRELGSLPGHAGGARGVAFSAHGRLLASGSGDGAVRLWDAETGQLLATQHGHTGAVYGVALSHTGRLVASASGDGTVRLWAPAAGGPPVTLNGHTGLVRDVAFSGDGRLLASSGGDGTVCLWEGATGQLVATWHGHTGPVYGAALSTDGRLLASGGVDGTVRLWDTASGACVRTLRSERRYERLDITGLTGVTEPQRAALLALGAIEHAPARRAS